MPNECIFCRIAEGALPAQRVYQDEQAVAFPDLNPQAPTHILIVPRRHLASLAGATAADAGLLGHLVWVAAQVARAQGLDQTGYRVAVNTGREGGQAIEHLHLHLLGGRAMSGRLG
ncbi:MAG: histidine triad nucleotide-binding protein [Chloroflexi bacterium]|nr:histidine triad nucleotide-binding protein [Chloroflexota bacterium]